MWLYVLVILHDCNSRYYIIVGGAISYQLFPHVTKSASVLPEDSILVRGQDGSEAPAEQAGTHVQASARLRHGRPLPLASPGTMARPGSHSRRTTRHGRVSPQ